MVVSIIGAITGALIAVFGLYYLVKEWKDPESKTPKEAATDIGLDAGTLAKPASSPEFASLLKIPAKNI